MSAEQQTGLAFMAAALVLAFLLVAAMWENAGIRQGYQQGYSQAKAGLCDSAYLSCNSDKKMNRERD